MDVIEIAKECCSYPVKVNDYHWCGEGEFIFNGSGLNEFAQRIEQPHLQKIEQLREALQGLLRCPAIHDVYGDDKDEETHEAELIARKALEQTK